MEKRSAFLLVLSTAIISGFSIYMNKFAIKGIDSDIFTFSKNLLVGIFMVSLILLVSRFAEFKTMKMKDWLSLLLIGLIGGSIPFLLYFKGLQLTSAASASLIHKSMFIYVAIFALVFLKEKLDKKVILAMLLLFAGNYLLIKPNWAFNAGDLLILSATFLWSVENIISKKILANLSGNMVAFGRMFFGSGFIFAYLLFTGKYNLLSGITSMQLQWILVSSAMLALYVITWYNGLKHVDVSLATAILLLGSPITTFLNMTSGATLTIDQAIGSLLLVIGVIAYMNATRYFRITELLTWSKKTRA